MEKLEKKSSETQEEKLKNNKIKENNMDKTMVIPSLDEFIKDKDFSETEKSKKIEENPNKIKTKTTTPVIDKPKTLEEKTPIKEKSKEIEKVPVKEKENLKIAKIEEKNKEKVKENKSNKKTRSVLKALLIIMFLLLFIIVFSTIFSITNINNKKIIKGVSVNGHDISNLEKSEAKKYLEEKLNNEEGNYIIATRNGIAETIYMKDIEGKFDVDKIVEEAYMVGRTGNMVQCNYEILLTAVMNKSIKGNISYNEEMLQKKIEEMSLKMPDVALGSSYTVQDNKLIIKNSTSGVMINKQDFTAKAIDAFSSNNKTFEITVQDCTKQEIDIEKIHSEVCKEAVNAYYTTQPYKIYKEESGIEFAISMEDAKKLVSEDREQFEIGLVEVKPKITVKDLDKNAFPDMLSTFTTYYGTGDTGRNQNIYLASQSITEAILMPGETFSFNDLIGECSTATGYKTATIYLNGKLSTGIGGGICQVSTTLYNAVLRANLEIVQRRNHSLSVTYVPLGHDAMVSIGSSDFKFKNNRDYPVKVVAYTGKGSITCQIYGLKTDTEYEVKLQSNVISKTEEKTKVQTYKILYLNGKEVSRTLLSTDTYKAH